MMNNVTLLLVFLGVLQGVTEFIPISSSGHLVIVEQTAFFQESMKGISGALAGITRQELMLFLNVALHLATLAAVVAFLRREIIALARGLFRGLASREFSTDEFRSAGNIIAACIPAGILGVLFHDFFESFHDTARPIFFLFLLNGAILIATRFVKPGTRKIAGLGIARSIMVGFFQALAILPGVSRSGSTIAGGLFLGMEPEESARFSFLMAIPVIGGAGLLEGLKVLKIGLPGDFILPLALACIVTAAVAFLSLKLLFYMVKKVRLDLFGYYTLALGIIGIILWK